MKKNIIVYIIFILSGQVVALVVWYLFNWNVFFSSLFGSLFGAFISIKLSNKKT